MLLIPLAVALLAAIVLGIAVVASIWPVLLVWVALLYSLGPRSSHRVEQVIGVLAIVASAAVYLLAPWHAGYGSRGLLPTTVWFVGPLVVAGVLVLLRGGPRRIRARRARFYQAQAARRSEQARLAKAVRVARKSDRTRARRNSIEARTGLDMDLVVEAARDTGNALHTTAGRLVRVAGRGMTRTLAAGHARRPRREPTPGRGAQPQGGEHLVHPDAWLDLDVDIDTIRSHDRTKEILRLSDELDGRRKRPLSRST